ncbi:IPT/TIG domain-containing protein [Streptomyces sp. NBC_00154]|uniref:IPT/TIG domain-containing protein n=1 Tax=Streptomyces sp. NBC_00154 TaxID=2975670 RepID=UPI002B1E58F3|nr:IPT/TIG domain-containing protein [Streptomyces sp. NBC_00154]
MTTAAGTSNPLNFYYIGAPFKASLSAASGPSADGNTVTISGTGLATASSVAFGGNNATATITSDSLLSVTVPAGTIGSVGVRPTSGSTSGGTAVTITGTDLPTTESVTFDGVIAPFSVINSTTVSVFTPPGSAGAVDVVLIATGGSATAAAGFTYVADPGI